MGIPVAVLLFALALSGLANDKEPPSQPTTEMGTLLVADRAAQELFDRTFGCGYIDGPARDAGDYWAFSARVGYGLELDPEPILVDKRTGVATWATRDRIERQRLTPFPEF